MRASALLLRWESYHWTCNLWVLIIYFSSQLCCPLWFQGSPQTRSESVSWCLKTSLFKTPFPGRSSVPTSFVFLSFIFFPTSFRRQWAAFLGAWCTISTTHLAQELLRNVQCCGGSSSYAKETKALKIRSTVAGHQKVTMTNWESHQCWSS